jgi:hypothetical protein
VYVRQPPGFKSPKYLDKVYKLSKALYGLKQAPQVWYTRFKMFLLEHGYVMGVWIRPSLLLIMALTFYLFKFTWMILSLVPLLTLLCPDFRK